MLGIPYRARSNGSLVVLREDLHGTAAQERQAAPAVRVAIQANASAALQAIVDLCYLTAQRISDVLAIRYSDVTDDGVYFQPSKTRKRTAAKAIVRWTPDLRAAVERAKDLHEHLRAFTLVHDKRGRPLAYQQESKLGELKLREF